MRHVFLRALCHVLCFLLPLKKTFFSPCSTSEIHFYLIILVGWLAWRCTFGGIHTYQVLAVFCKTAVSGPLFYSEKLDPFCSSLCDSCQASSYSQLTGRENGIKPPGHTFCRLIGNTCGANSGSVHTHLQGTAEKQESVERYHSDLTNSLSLPLLCYTNLIPSDRNQVSLIYCSLVFHVCSWRGASLIFSG